MPYSMPDVYYQDTQLSTAKIESAYSGERALWQRVILQAITDAQGKANGIKKEERQDAIQQAIRWFKGNGENFQEVCLMAGFEPSMVRKNVMMLLRKGGVIV